MTPVPCNIDGNAALFQYFLIKSLLQLLAITAGIILEYFFATSFFVACSSPFYYIFYSKICDVGGYRYVLYIYIYLYIAIKYNNVAFILVNT